MGFRENSGKEGVEFGSFFCLKVKSLYWVSGLKEFIIKGFWSKAGTF